MSRKADRCSIRNWRTVWTVLALICVAVMMSLAVGARALSPHDTLRAVFWFDPSRAVDVIVWEMRMPRTVTGLVTGTALAAAGLVMQQICRNPLADPGILGVNAGAALAVVLSIWLLRWQSPIQLSIVAVCGAGLAALAVFTLGRASKACDRAGILRLTLAGIAISALCVAFISGIVLLDQETRDLYRFWTIGSLSGGRDTAINQLLPLILIGLGLIVLMARRMDALALGTDTGRSFGVSAEGTFAVVLLAVALLTGGAVALAGPIGFIGLIVPHLTRWLVGPSILPGLLVGCPMGGAALLICDSLGRVLARPAEVQVGIILALIGGPVFLAMVRKVAQ